MLVWVFVNQVGNMKIYKDLVKIKNKKELISLETKNNYLFIIGKYGVHYLLMNDLLFLKALENFLFYNQFNLRIHLIKNLLALKFNGSSVGWFSELQLIGLGFRVKLLSTGFLLLNLGYSHAFAIKVPKGINLLINKDCILLFSLDLILLGNFISKLIRLRRMDVYKGKGIKLVLKNIKLKEGKKQKL